MDDYSHLYPAVAVEWPVPSAFSIGCTETGHGLLFKYERAGSRRPLDDVRPVPHPAAGNVSNLRAALQEIPELTSIPFPFGRNYLPGFSYRTP
ncbi:hypothetical protein AM571_PA00272 (plasmid) [Rhizobium etli 8C-3]|uniref:Uncharacterized protein n=1 Tax=Rhizobium etli 8C-3 TaxID=538025 RepID=A0A1L5PAF3_RHIET|nr:hypothetical protein [Rhizobium etli]APO77155.1 hypothetical protein AM571_PA00272 [Rhizobium etli 8C-3]